QVVSKRIGNEARPADFGHIEVTESPEGSSDDNLARLANSAELIGLVNDQRLSVRQRLANGLHAASWIGRHAIRTFCQGSFRGSIEVENAVRRPHLLAPPANERIDQRF